MSKKKTTQPVALVQHAEVSNNINLNLNQNDLIDLAIQENLENLTTKIDVVKKEIFEIQSKCKDIGTAQAEIIAKKLLQKDKDYILFQSIVKDNKLEVRSRYTLNENNYKELGTYMEIYDDCPYSSLSTVTRNTRELKFYMYEFSGVNMEIVVDSGSMRIVYNKGIKIEEKDLQKLYKELEPLNNKWYELLKLKYELQREFYEYTFGEKRIKAKIVKASLNKTAEGQAILSMLQGATGIKLIG